MKSKLDFSLCWRALGFLIFSSLFLSLGPLFPAEPLVARGEPSTTNPVDHFAEIARTTDPRIPIVTAVGGPSSLAVELAHEFKMTLVGFLRNRQCIIYTGGQRIGRF